MRVIHLEEKGASSENDVENNWLLHAEECKTVNSKQINHHSVKLALCHGRNICKSSYVRIQGGYKEGCSRKFSKTSLNNSKN